jgi:hypothetical protein
LYETAISSAEPVMFPADVIAAEPVVAIAPEDDTPGVVTPVVPLIVTAIYRLLYEIL